MQVPRFYRRLQLDQNFGCGKEAPSLLSHEYMNKSAQYCSPCHRSEHSCWSSEVSSTCSGRFPQLLCCLQQGCTIWRMHQDAEGAGPGRLNGTCLRNPRPGFAMVWTNGLQLKNSPELEGDWTFVVPGMQCWVVAVVEVGCRSVERNGDTTLCLTVTWGHILHGHCTQSLKHPLFIHTKGIDWHFWLESQTMKQKNHL